MRKIITATVLLLTILSSLYSEGYVAIAPYSGAFGVPLASKNYVYKYTDESFKWVADTTPLDTSDKTYQNQQMIALLGGYEIPLSFIQSGDKYVTDGLFKNYSVEVEATCAGGFYFTSQSNPAFKRPFQILFVLKTQTEGAVGDNEEQLPTKKDDTTICDGIMLIGEGDGATTSFRFSFPSDTEYKVDKEEKTKNNTARLKCDVVLVLPYDKDGIDTYNDRITWNKAVYPLAEVDDYIAQVQFNVTLRDGNKVVSTYSVSVPFSGYYDRASATVDKLQSDSISNMYVTPSSEAARIDIREAITNSSEIHVGDINMWVGVTGLTKKADGTYEDSNKNPYDPKIAGPKIFASAYRDPNAIVDSVNGEGFLLVHDSVADNSLLGDTNSVRYTVRFTDAEKGTHFDFRGNTNIEYYTKSENSEKWIKPEIEAVPYNPPGGGYSANYYYYHYSGSISVILDQRDNPIMFPGRYTGNIYIHMVSGV